MKGLPLLRSLAIPQLMLLAPLVNFLIYHGYPFTRPEALGELASWSVVGLVLSLPLILGGQRVRTATLALLVLLFVDFQFNLGKDLPGWVAGAVPLRTGVAALVVFAAGYALIYAALNALRAHAETLLVVVFGIILASSLVMPGAAARPEAGPQAAAAQPDRRLPLVVHLLLDEHPAPAALPAEAPGTAEARAAVTALYQDNGFTLWSRAFSRFFDTEESMAATMNFSGDDYARTLAALEPGQGRFAYALNSSAYFELMAGRGYRIHVFQTPHLDYCGRTRAASVESCRTFAATGLSSLAEEPVGVRHKFALVHGIYARRSFAYLVVKRGYARGAAALGLPAWAWERDSVGPIPSRAMLGEVLNDIKQSGRGTMVFAHLLFPHHPYAYRADCSLHPLSEEWLRLDDSTLAAPASNTATGRIARYAKLGEQIRCASRSLAELFDGIRQAGLWDDAVVIVQGDHGSRITLVEPHLATQPHLSDSDLVDGFATLLAIKAPGLGSGVDTTPVAVHDRIAAFLQAPGYHPGAATVFLKDRGKSGMFQRAPMPRFGD